METKHKPSEAKVQKGRLDDTILSSVKTKVPFKMKIKSIIVPTLVVLITGGLAIMLVFIIKITN